MNTKPISDFLRKLSVVERIYLKNVFEISVTIRQTIREFEISKKEFCNAMKITQRKYEDYYSGAHNYSLHDIANLETLRFNKIMAQKENEAKQESEVITAPKYKYS